MIRGLAMGMGIELMATGGALLISRADIHRLKERLAEADRNRTSTVAS
jgi:hypothetical protein